MSRHGRSPLLRLQTDERLVTFVRRGNQHAFEALVSRYESRLLAFCRHMLGSREDAEDVLQEVFAAAFNAMQADERAINVRPWLYRIARNRSLNHLRRTQAVGVDSMDIHLAEGGQTTADKVHKREDFRMLIVDVQGLPETQRTALLLREIDALSYEQIAEAMDTTVPSIKSLLVRARVSLAEAAEARQISCEDVRLHLGEVSEGLTRMLPPVRRHLRFCDPCGAFRSQLKQTNRALAAVFPIGPLVLIKKFALAHLGGAGTAGGTVAAGTATAGSAAGGLVGAGVTTVTTKAAAGLAAAAIVTAGAVEVQHVAIKRENAKPTAGAVAAVVPRSAPAQESPVVAERFAERLQERPAGEAKEEKPSKPEPAAKKVAKPAAPAGAQPAAGGAEPAAGHSAAPHGTQEASDTTTLPPQTPSPQLSGAGPAAEPAPAAEAPPAPPAAEPPPAPPPPEPAPNPVPSPAPKAPVLNP